MTPKDTAEREHLGDRDQGRALQALMLIPLQTLLLGLVTGRMGVGVSLLETGNSILPLQEEEEPKP